MQTGFGLILSVSAMIFVHIDAGKALFCGAGVCMVANIFMYRCAFAYAGATQAKKIIKGFYIGEIGKLVLSAIGFGAALGTKMLHPLWFFIGYLSTQGAFWVYPVWSALYQKNNNR